MNAKRGEVTTAEIDLREGGKWRYVMVAEGGFEVAFHGEYREIVPNERVDFPQVAAEREAIFISTSGTEAPVAPRPSEGSVDG